MVLLDLKLLAVLSGLSCLYMVNMLLITQVHWMVDIIGGLIFSVWCYRTIQRVIGFIDMVVSLPYRFTVWVYGNTCKDRCQSK